MSWLWLSLHRNVTMQTGGLAGWQKERVRHAEGEPWQHFIMSVSKVESSQCAPLAPIQKPAAMAYIIFNFVRLAQYYKRENYNEMAQRAQDSQRIQHALQKLVSFI